MFSGFVRHGYLKLPFAADMQKVFYSRYTKSFSWNRQVYALSAAGLHGCIHACFAGG
jgi:hypothetical protein